MIQTKHAFRRHYVNLAFFILALSLPLSIPIVRNALILFATVMLTSYFFEKNTNYHNNNDRGLFIGIISFFMLLVLSILIHPPTDFSSLESRWPLFLIPVILFYTRLTIDEAVRKHAMKGFIIGNYLAIIYNLVRAIYKSTHIIDGKVTFDSTVWGNIPVWESIDHVGNYFFSIYLSDFMHPTYWALFLTTAIVFTWLYNPLNSNPLVKMCSVVLFFVFIFLCSSRAGIIGSFITILILIFTSLKVFQSFYIRLAILISLASIILLMLLNPRMADFVKSVEEQTVQESLRVNAWASAIAIIKENPVLGVGLQNAEPEMLSQYRKRGLEEHYNLKLNAHNQYLETLLSTGMLGLSVLVIILITLFRKAFAQKGLLLFLFALNLTLHFCFESMLNRFHGIVFFTFFTLILFTNNSRKGQAPDADITSNSTDGTSSVSV